MVKTVRSVFGVTVAIATVIVPLVATANTITNGNSLGSIGITDVATNVTVGAVTIPEPSYEEPVRATIDETASRNEPPSTSDATEYPHRGNDTSAMKKQNAKAPIPPCCRRKCLITCLIVGAIAVVALIGIVLRNNGIARFLVIAAIPVVIPLAIWGCGKCFGNLHIPLMVLGFIAISLGHIFMFLFWKSFDTRPSEKQKASQPAKAELDISPKDFQSIRKFLEQTFDHRLKLKRDYRFPNGMRADLVIMSERGAYPMVCIEIINEDEGKKKIENAAHQLFALFQQVAKISRFFILIRNEEGGFKLLKARSPRDVQVVGAFAPESYDEINETFDKAVKAAKMRKFFYPLLFLFWTVTPLIECIVMLSFSANEMSNEGVLLIIFWMSAFLGAFGVGIKGYVPLITELTED